MGEDSLQAVVAGVRFSRLGKVYHFHAADIADLRTGDQVVVETVRGWQLGDVIQIFPAEDYAGLENLKRIDRRATPRDLVLRQSWQAREEQVVASAMRRAGELRLRGIKIISAEYSFDGSRLTIQFSTESEEKYDLKSLRQDMQREFNPALVELRVIGPRDVAKMMCGMGACGMENRCCSQFLCEFNSISIRMAKEQGISLTPTEITGMCGRLRCCLIYEYEQYTQSRALLPKRNKRIMTPAGEARVLDQMPIRDAVYVVLADDTRREFHRSEIQLIGEDGSLTPAMSAEELAEYRASQPAPEAPPEPLQAAAYTLPPQPRSAAEPRTRDPRTRDGEEGRRGGAQRGEGSGQRNRSEQHRGDGRNRSGSRQRNPDNRNPNARSPEGAEGNNRGEGRRNSQAQAHRQPPHSGNIEAGEAGAAGETPRAQNPRRRSGRRGNWRPGGSNRSGGESPTSGGERNSGDS